MIDAKKLIQTIENIREQTIESFYTNNPIGSRPDKYASGYASGNFLACNYIIGIIEELDNNE